MSYWLKNFFVMIDGMICGSVCNVWSVDDFVIVLLGWLYVLVKVYVLV